MKYAKHQIPANTKVNGHQGWHDIVFNNLLSDVQGYIRAGFAKEKALELAFSGSCASQKIKAEVTQVIEDQANE